MNGHNEVFHRMISRCRLTKIAVLKCNTHLDNARVNTRIAELSTIRGCGISALQFFLNFSKNVKKNFFHLFKNPFLRGGSKANFFGVPDLSFGHHRCP